MKRGCYPFNQLVWPRSGGEIERPCRAALGRGPERRAGFLEEASSGDLDSQSGFVRVPVWPPRVVFEYGDMAADIIIVDLRF
jgi:hypothetical protein